MKAKKILGLSLFVTLMTFGFSNAQNIDTLPNDVNSANTDVYCPKLTVLLRYGDRDTSRYGQVTELQKFLKSYFALADKDYITSGIFGALTRKHVINYQAENDIILTGVVGAVSRAKISEVCGDSVNSPVSTNNTNTTTTRNNPSSSNSTTPSVSSNSWGTSTVTNTGATTSAVVTPTTSVTSTSTGKTYNGIEISLANYSKLTGYSINTNWADRPTNCINHSVCMNPIEAGQVIGQEFLSTYPLSKEWFGPFTFSETGGADPTFPPGISYEIVNGNMFRLKGTNRNVITGSTLSGNVNSFWKVCDATGDCHPFLVSFTSYRPGPGMTGYVSITANGKKGVGPVDNESTTLTVGSPVNFQWTSVGTSKCTISLTGPYASGKTTRTINFSSSATSGSQSQTFQAGDEGGWQAAIDCPITTGGSAPTNTTFVVASPVKISPAGTTINVPLGTIYGGMVNGVYQGKALTATGGSGGTYKWSVVGGALPPGYSMNGDGNWTINATTPGTYTATIRATDYTDQNLYDEQKYTWVIAAGATTNGGASSNPPIVVSPASQTINIADKNLPPGSMQMTASGGTGSYSWSSSGALPPGYSFNSAGVFTWGPTQSGTYTAQITARDSSGATGQASFTWIVQ